MSMRFLLTRIGAIRYKEFTYHPKTIGLIVLRMFPAL